MAKLPECEYRFGFTGTLDGTHTNKLVLEGIFGPVKKVTTTAELIEQKHLADFTVKCIILQHTDENRNLMKKALYKDEIEWIVMNKHRNKFIKNLALSLKGNTLILFQFVEKHGKVLQEMFGNPEDKIMLYVDGNVDGELREDVRVVAESNDNVIIIASSGTFSTGVNIKNIHNIIFASPSKSRVRNLQSVGRGLRRSEGKQRATLYDIADDLSWKAHKNHTLKHFEERMKIYGSEKFPYKIYTIQLKE
jgi:superfamily II DNA or RNA helicase